MHTRKTLLAWAVVALGITALLVPPLLGLRLEQELRAGIAANARQGPLHWQLLDYHRGLYSSRARSRIELLSPQGDPLALGLEHHIRHGIGVTGLHYGYVTTTLRLDGEAGAAVRTLFADAEPLTVLSRLELDGEIRGRVLSPPATGTLALQRHPLLLTWQGLEGEYRIRPDRSVHVDLVSPGLVSRGARSSLHLDGLRLSGQAQRSRVSGLWLGDSRLQLTRARLESRSPPVSFDELSLETGAHEADGLVQSSLRYHLRQLQIGSDRVNDLRFRLTASNLDAGALKAYELRLAQLARPPAGTGEVIAEALRSQLPALLARRPQLSLDEAQLGYEGSVMRLSGALRYVGINPHDAFSPLTDLAGEAQLQLPRALLVKVLQRRLEGRARRKAQPPAEIDAMAQREADAFLERLHSSGVLLAADPQTCTAVLRLQEGRLSLNGRPLGGLPGALPAPEPPGGV